MNVVKSVETRITRPVYLTSKDGSKIHMSVFHGRGYVTPVPAEKVKVTRLKSGKYSVRCIGGGFSRTVHVNPSTQILAAVKGGDHFFGEVSSLFE